MEMVSEDVKHSMLSVNGYKFRFAARFKIELIPKGMSLYQVLHSTVT